MVAAKRKTKNKPPSAKRRSNKAQKPFLGDKILAIYSSLTSCCCIGMGSIVSAAGVGIAAAAPYKAELKKLSPEFPWGSVLKPEIGYGIAIGAAIMTVFSIWYLVSVWRSRKWSLWWTAFWSSFNVIVAGYFWPEYQLQLILPAIIAIYAILRIAGLFGPKL